MKYLRDYFRRKLEQTGCMQIVEGLGTRAFARIGFPRPFRTIERNQWGKNCLLAYLRHFRLDGIASSRTSPRRSLLSEDAKRFQSVQTRFLTDGSVGGIVKH